VISPPEKHGASGGLTPRTLRLALHPLVLGALSGSLGLVLLLWGPPGPDVPAHLYEIAEFRSRGFHAWDNLWYGGRYAEVGYSLIFAPAAATLGLVTILTASAAGASAAFAGVARRRWGDRSLPAAAAFALLAPSPILAGQYPFMLGAGLALGALWALQTRRVVIALALLLLSSAASPLAFVFVLVPLAAAAVTTGSGGSRSARRGPAWSSPRRSRSNSPSPAWAPATRAARPRP
jgi:hypothetical protein